MNLKNLNILVVDDDNVTCDYFKIILTKKFATVDIVHSGQDAINMAKQNKYDVIIMDIRMYPMDGITTKNEIKKIQPDVKIIGQSAIYLALENVGSEFDDFFVKPFKMKQIEDSFKRVLKLDSKINFFN